MLVQHHIKYKEIHGEDEIVLMEYRDHNILHRRLRKEGKCNIDPKDLYKISCAAHSRTQKRKISKRNMDSIYQTKYVRTKSFKTNIELNFSELFRVNYNSCTNSLTFLFTFKAENNFKLYYIK